MGTHFQHTLMKYMAGNFSCREIARIITEYLEGSLTFGERVRFQLHLGLCFACRRYLRQIKYTIATLGQLPSEPVPSHIKDELLKRFQTWKRQSPQSSGKPEIE